MLVDTCNYHETDILLLLPTSRYNKYSNTFGKVLQYPFDTVSFFETVHNATSPVIITSVNLRSKYIKC